MGRSGGALLTLPQVAQLAEVEYRTLHAWLKRGLISPSLQASSGPGTPNLFSAADAVLARILADLRRAGLGLDALQRAADELRQRGTELPRDDFLVLNGRVTLVDAQRPLVEALDRPEPALIYRIAWAWEAVSERITEQATAVDGS